LIEDAKDATEKLPSTVTGRIEFTGLTCGSVRVMVFFFFPFQKRKNKPECKHFFNNRVKPSHLTFSRRLYNVRTIYSSYIISAENERFGKKF
jgi:hypothetical protein